MQLFQRFSVLLALFFSGLSSAAAPDDFDAAKRIAQKIYSDESTEFYCACPLRWIGGKGQVDLRSCGYEVRKNGPRAQRIEWEHVVPAQQFGANRTCWQQGGRERCGQQDRDFQAIEANLFNLRPALGEVNGDRAHFRFAELPDVPARHGACPVRIDFQRQLAQPRPEIRGDIARIYFYMADRYQLTLSAAEQRLFLRWHQQDPVDDREMTLMRRTAQYMGHQNEFVTGAKQWYQGYLSNQSAFHSRQDSVAPTVTDQSRPVQNQAVRGNKNSKKYHFSHCSGFAAIKPDNQLAFASVSEAQEAGFVLAGNCKPQQH